MKHQNITRPYPDQGTVGALGLRCWFEVMTT